MKKQGEETYNEHSSNRTNWNKHNRFFNYGTYILLAVKKLTVNLAVAWEGIGIGLVLVGAIPVLSSWCYLIGEGTVVAMFLVGAVAVWSGYELSVQISSLSLKTQELAMQVSLLNQENERMLKALSELTGKDVRDI